VTGRGFLCYLDRMLKAARQILRRFGVLGALLVALVAIVPAGEALACSAPEATATVVQSPEPASDGCRDCGPACLHGCCHASHIALPGEDSPVVTPLRFRSPVSWAHVAGVPLGAPEGLDRPPRA
jgi:hypothetical protein